MSFCDNYRKLDGLCNYGNQNTLKKCFDLLNLFLCPLNKPMPLCDCYFCNFKRKIDLMVNDE